MSERCSSAHATNSTRSADCDASKSRAWSTRNRSRRQTSRARGAPNASVIDPPVPDHAFEQRRRTRSTTAPRAARRGSRARRTTGCAGIEIRRGRAATVPAAAGRDVREQVVVAAGEDRRPQRRDERHRVAGVRDRAHHREQVTDLLRVVDQRAGLGTELDPARPQRVHERTERRTRRQQDRDVVGAGVAPRLRPLSSTGHDSGSARIPATASATAAASSSRRRAAVIFCSFFSSAVWGPPRSTTRWSPPLPARWATSGSYRGRRPATSSSMTTPNTAFTQSTTAGTVRKFVVNRTDSSTKRSRASRNRPMSARRKR